MENIQPVLQGKFKESTNRDEVKNLYHTECVSYKMASGDVATYSVVSSDSIIVVGEPALLRQRIEKHKIACDSVIDGIMYYTQSMTDYVSMESKEYIMDVKRTEHPWTEVSVQISIDSLGYRYSASTNRTSGRALQSPGGAFQPGLLPVLDYGCRHIGEKWTFKNKYDTPETSYPAARWDEHVFYAMLPPVDTLGTNAVKIELNRTAVNNLDVPINDKSVMQIVNSKNSFGFVYFDRDVPVPILQEITSENKMKIYGFNEKPTETHHYYDSKIILESYVQKGNKQSYKFKPTEK
jgi:hypothetical protein